MFLINIKASFSFSAWCKPWTTPAPLQLLQQRLPVSEGHPPAPLFCVHFSCLHGAAWGSCRHAKVWSHGPGEAIQIPSLSHPTSLSCVPETCPPVNTYTNSSLSLRVSYSVVPSLEQFLFLSLCSLLTENFCLVVLLSPYRTVSALKAGTCLISVC